MNKFFRALVLSSALISGQFAIPAPAAMAQGMGGGCSIQQAADLAVQKQLALLDAAKVDSSQFFNGVNSCLGSNLLSNLDLSNLIPTSFDFSGAASGIINSVIQQAQQQVCQVLNQQLQKIVGNINGNMFSFQSLIGDQMSELMGSGSSSISQINLPNIPGIGQYNFSKPETGAGGAPVGLTTPVVNTPSPQQGSTPINLPVPLTNGGLGSLGDIFR